jgi:1-acyl-sn-glycerol-3-phosphate acyltransferase
MSKRADSSYSPAWRRLTVIVLPPVINGLMKHDWHGQENIRNVPADSGLILAINHLSYADVLAMCLFTYKSGRYPVFLAKSALFEMKGLGSVMRGTGQLPVYRGQTDAALVLRDAEQGLRSGACVIFYPEATATRDPDLWPMAAKTGVARLALSTGVPVIPIAHWGAQRILPYGSFRPHLLPRTTVQVVAGPPVDLSAFAGQPLNSKVLREATEVIMKDITGLLAGIRGETPPAEPYHPAVARRKARQEARESNDLSITDAPADQAPDGSGTIGSGSAASDMTNPRSATPQTASAEPVASDTGASDTGASDTGASDTGASDTGASDTAASGTGATPT